MSSSPGRSALTAPIRIAVAGALGRMGRAVAAAVDLRDDCEVFARFDRPGAEGEGVVERDQALAAAQAVIDFSTPAASADLARACAARGEVALVIGSTGFDEAQIAAIDAAAKTIPIVRAGNFSLGVNMLLGLVEEGGGARRGGGGGRGGGRGGPAGVRGGAAARGRGVALAEVARRVRDGITGERPAGEIGFSVQRGGGIIGEHSVLFAAQDEILTLSHSARDRGLFARGAVEAALWAVRQPPGAYDMVDVLGLRSRR